MTKRYNSKMVAHVWAQQRETAGQNSNGQFYFQGATIFSYGAHFPIATFHKVKGGEPFVLFTTRARSMTTSKHKGYARNAIPGGVPIFDVADDPRHLPLKAYWEGEIQARVLEAGAARGQKVKERLIGEGVEIARQANAYAALTGARWRLKEPDVSPEFLARAKKAARAAELRETKAKEAAARKLREDRAADITAWLAGAAHYVPQFDAECGGPALRVVAGELQTSYGARVPFAHATRAFQFIKACREKGREWHCNGHTLHVGHFTVESVSAAGDIVAGCHTIRWPEIERVAILAGIFDKPASTKAPTPSAKAS